jgi:hypothetical protein
MKRKFFPAIALGLVLLSATPLAGGDIYVGGPWGTRIDRLPHTISAPGAYYLGGNLTYAGAGDGITITQGVKHVTLDLMGFTINGSGSGHYGIYLNGSKNVEIRNGTMSGWATGIKEGSSIGKLHRIINVRAVGNGTGIQLTGAGHLIQGCEVTGTGSNTAVDIACGSVNGCSVTFGDGTGINAASGIVSDNVVLGTGAGSNRKGISVTSLVALVKDNRVSGCNIGIWGDYGLNVIGNTVDAASGTTGIYLQASGPNLLDQNSVTGAGTHYNDTYSSVTKRTNY